MKKIGLFLILTAFCSAACRGQSDVKMVYDKSQENQILSTTYSQWKFYPEWYYDAVHKKYVEDYGNNDDWLLPLTKHSEAAKKKVIDTHKEINVVYEQEVAKWNDRTNDWEYSTVENDIELLKSKLKEQTALFSKYKVDINNAEDIYEEFERLEEKTLITQKAHLENEKRRKQYQDIITNYQMLIGAAMDLNSIFKTINNK